MMSPSVRSKSFLVVAFLLLAVAILCTQIPLLNYLGYEFSFLNALVAGFLCGLYAVVRWNADTPMSERSYWGFVQSTLSSSLLLALVPFVVMSANAFFVRNCSFTQGVRLYVLYVVPSIIFSVSLGTFSSVIARKHRKTLFVVLFLLVLAHIPYVTLTRPQIFAFNPIAGYFPGFSYDESLGGETRLLVYRVSTLAASAFLFTITLLALRFSTVNFNKPGSQRSLVTYGALLAASFIVCMGLYRISDTVGLSSSASFITNELGGVRYTPHFKIVYPRKSVTPGRLRQIALLHEYLFDELREEWKINPGKHITVFIYESPGQKERLIGAAATDFTKPWLRQININLGDIDVALKHEMVHAMLAEWGIPFLQVAPNSGLIEGAAVASERYEYGESLHRLAAQIFALGIRPDVAQMFTLSGFFKSYPGVSYVLAGSFCRYLIDRYGVTKFKNLYDNGNFERWYGKDVDSLVAEWHAVINRDAMTSHELAKAAYLFKRSPVFGKECARVIADINQRTRQLTNRKEYSAALASAEQSLRLTKSADAAYQKSYLLLRLGHYDSAGRFMQEQLADSTLRTSLLPLHLLLGDSYWALNEFDRARGEYAALLTDSLSLSTNEATAVRLQILSDQSARTALRPYFLEDMNDSTRLAFLEKLKENPSTDPIARYLLGREFSAKENDGMVVQELRVLPPMNSPILEYLRNRRLARAMYNLGDYERAKVYAWRGLNFAASNAELYQLEDLLRRCFWVQDQMR